MKNKKIKLLVSFFVILTTFSLPVFSEEAIVTYIKGKVEMQSGDKWLPLQVGQKIPENTIISTGFQSQTRIQYKGTVMALGPLTRITLEKLAENEKKEVVNVYLNVGAVRSKVTHPENKRVSQSIRNPVTVCSVRGTEYICFASGRVICFEGAVAVFPAKLISPSFFANMSTDDVDDEVNYDSADATTDANDIASFAPKNVIVVAAGQEVCVLADGTIQNPVDNATEFVKRVKKNSMTKSEAESESFSNDFDSSVISKLDSLRGSVIVDVVLPQE
ncbi:MAG: hypothetical protein E7059_03355 [Treponema bryantii]|nr:hypothetical protein [Treponema bryantii]